MIAGLKGRGANGMAHTDYGIEVLRIVSTFIDGHATVRDFRYPEGELLFLIEGTADRFVAIRPDRAGFVDPDRPYLTRGLIVDVRGNTGGNRGALDQNSFSKLDPWTSSPRLAWHLLLPSSRLRRTGRSPT